jgi:predicted DNA-binding transcriptional regulator AlpA
MSTRQFWRLPRVMEETGYCARAIYQGMKDGTFPQNFPISKQARAWTSDEVEAWKAARLAERDAFDRAAASDLAQRRRGRRSSDSATTEAA